MTFSSRFLTRTRIVALITLLALAGITWIRMSLVNDLPDQGFFAKYTEIASEILAGHIPLDRLGDLSTGYLWVVVLFLGPLGMDSVALRTAQIIGVSLAAAICGAAVWRRWGLGAGLGAAIVLLASKAALVNATEIEPETLILVLTSIGLSLIISSDRPSLRMFSGLALGLAVVTRPSVLLPIVLAIVGLGWRAQPRKRLLAVLPVIIGVAVPVLAVRLAITTMTGAPPTPMNPGTVLSEGWNPLATGYLGEAPVVVKDIEHGLGVPDGLHVAYRLVAARATGRPMSPQTANTYWAGRALAFVRNEPAAALKLGLRKAGLALHSYDAWDLKTLQRRAENLAGGPFIPFGLLAALAALGLFFRWRQPWIPALGLWIAGSWLVMVLFYVTSRQRNVLLPAVALLTGAAINGIISAWRSDRRRMVGIALTVALLSGVLVSIEGAAQREDRHGWRLLEVQEATAREVKTAQREDEVALWLARGALFLDPIGLRTADPRIIDREIRGQLAEIQPPQRLFDLALVMIKIGRYGDAERLLRSLDAEGYRPRRGARWCSSTAYQLARCRVMASDFSGAQPLIEQALRQAPGDPRILALQAVLSDLAGNSNHADFSRNCLSEMFDPFTRDQALAQAYSDTGQPSAAGPLLAEIQATLPEWTGSP